MGLFDYFRTKSPSEVMEEEMKRLAPQLFPGGHDEIVAAGKSISGMLDNRIPPDGAARLYASTRYLAHTAKDRSKARVVEYIIRQGMGKLSTEDASAIYDRFIAAVFKNQPQQSDGALLVNVDLGNRQYVLANTSHSIRVSAVVFATLLLGLRSNGWTGAADLFYEGGNMMKALSGSYTISAGDAKEMASLLSNLVASTSDSELEAAIRPLLSIASQGAFTLCA